jgi:hypothetical protein
MAKNLASKLRTGAMIGLAGLALGATAPKANADFIPYNSGTIGVTNTVPTGNLIISYDQTIKEIDTNGDSIMDSYLSTLSVRNETQDIIAENSSYFLMNVNADLAGRGCTGLTNDWLNWTYSKTGADSGQFLMPSSGEWPLFPGTSDNFYYTIPKDQVLGWENVDAQMGANAGSVNFGFQAPKAVPEPTTVAILASGAVALLGLRRIRDRYK